MTLPPLPPARWAAEGARVAGSLDEVAAAVVIGREADAAAFVALGIARALPGTRSVALGDLTGGAGPLRLAGADGLAACLGDGRPVSDVARPLDDGGRLFLLPTGAPIPLDATLLASPRWARLVAGFREVDALLLLVATAGMPGLAALVESVDGVIAVDLPPTEARAWPLLAVVDRPEDELPPVRSAAATGAAGEARERPTPRASARTRPRGRRVAALALGLLALGGLAATLAAGDRLPWRSDVTRSAVTDAGEAMGARAADDQGDPGRDPDATGADSSGADRSGATVESQEDAGRASAVVTLGPVVNPADSATAAAWTIELVAANTPEGANSRLVLRGVTLPAPTLAPVPLGSDGRPWYRALAGAWRSRAEAEGFLASLRERGVVRPGVGRVLRAPFALMLEEGVPRGDVPAALARWEARGIRAYALVQDDGRTRLYAGAFETHDQAAPLAASLHDLGAAPVVAFRTGRAF